MQFGVMRNLMEQDGIQITRNESLYKSIRTGRQSCMAF